MKRSASDKALAGSFLRFTPWAGRGRVFWCLSLIIVLGFGVYANSLSNGFLWDDISLVRDNARLGNWHDLPKVFSENIFAGAGRPSSFYRPLQTVTLMADHALGGIEPRGYHLGNVVFHVSAALALFWLLCLLFSDVTPALLASLFFVVHPVHTEAVAYVSGRADPLSALFVFLAYVFFVKYLRTGRAICGLLMAVCYIAALLSKESALIFPFLALLYSAAFEKRFSIKKILPLFVIALIYIGGRLTARGSFLAPDESVATACWQRLPGSFVALAQYGRLLLLPLGLHMEYGYENFKLVDPRAVAGIVLFAGGILSMARAKKRDPLVFFGLGWFFIAWLPVSNLYPLNAYMAEHWLYLPSVGFFVLLGRAAATAIKDRRVLPMAAVILSLVFWGFLTVRQNAYWRDPIAFYERALRYSPFSWKVYNNLGNSYSDAGEEEKAQAAYRKALELNPRDAQAHYNLGNLYNEAGRDAEAIACYEQALALDPIQVRAFNNLGNVYGRSGRYPEAIAAYEKAIALAPASADIFYNLAKVFKDAGREQDALAAYRRAIEIDPGRTEACYNLANLLRALGRDEEAVAFYEQVLRLDPSHQDAYNNLGILYAAAGDRPKAILLFEKAVALNPGYARGYYNIAVLCYQDKQYARAIDYCDKAAARGYDVGPDFLKMLKPFRK